MNKITRINYTTLLCIIILSVLPATSFAQDHEQTKIDNEKRKTASAEWEMHQSVTNIFNVKFKKEYKYKVFPFQFNKDTIAYTAEIVSPMVRSKTSDKSSLIKVKQTFGSEFTTEDVESILSKDAEEYLKLAKDFGGELLIDEDIKHNGFEGKELYVSYDNKGEKYGLRIKIYLTDYSKVEQILNAPADTIYSYMSNNFFDSLKLFDGRIQKENPIGVGWVEYTSKNNIFTSRLPPKNSDYAPNLPIFTVNPPNLEIMNFEIIDPVTSETILHNVYSYRGSKELSGANVRHKILNTHLSRFVRNLKMDKLKTESSIIDGVNVMKAKIIIKPNHKFPGISVIFIEARYEGNTLVIQEFACGARFVKSGLKDTLFGLMEFHPERYKAAAN